MMGICKTLLPYLDATASRSCEKCKHARANKHARTPLVRICRTSPSTNDLDETGGVDDACASNMRAPLGRVRVPINNKKRARGFVIVTNPHATFALGKYQRSRARVLLRPPTTNCHPSTSGFR